MVRTPGGPGRTLAVAPAAAFAVSLCLGGAGCTDPERALPEDVSPEDASSKDASSKDASSEDASSKDASSEDASPGDASSRHSAARRPGTDHPTPGDSPRGRTPSRDAASRDTAPGDVRRLDADTVLETLDADAATLAGHVEVLADERSESFLLTLVTAEPSDTVGIATVTDPTGRLLHDTRFEADSWDAVSLSSRIANEALVGTGDLALFLPASPREPLRPGRYRVAFEVDPPDTELARVSLAVRSRPTPAASERIGHGRSDADGAAREREPADGSVPPDTAFDATSRLIDLQVTVLHTDPALRGEAYRREIDTGWRHALDVVLGPHALGVGRIDVLVADVRRSARFAELDDEEETDEACRVMRSLEAGHRGARVGADDAGEGGGEVGAAAAVPTILHVGLVAEIVDASSGDWTTGLSPQPGRPFETGSPNGCVFVAERPWSTGAAPLGEDGGEGAADRSSPREAITAMLAANLVHELGHFAGLAHTSEADGETFDPLEDTPRCERAARDGLALPDADHGDASGGGGAGEPDGIVDQWECADGGGADNVMFWSGDADSGPWTLTPDQAWLLRRHPLFRRAGN